MKRGIYLFAVFMFVVMVAGAIYVVVGRGRGTKEAPSPGGRAAEPSARVRTAVIRQGAIDRTIHVYGNVIPAPGAVRTISVAYESLVHRIMVNEGQEVLPGELLLRVGPSPETRLKFDQAREADRVAEQALANMERKFQLKLATNDQLLQARQAAEQAELALSSLKKQGADIVRDMTAATRGLVSKVAVDQGAIVPAGDPLVQVVPENQLEVKLGVEPEDIDKVRPGVDVSLSRPLAPASKPVSGKVRKFSRSINTQTRLVDVFVAVSSNERFLLGQWVSGRIVVSSVSGLIVPRSAVLPEGKGFTLFVVKGGRAFKKKVRVLAENRSETALSGEEIKAGDQIVIMGNYELTDNMAVAAEPPR